MTQLIYLLKIYIEGKHFVMKVGFDINKNTAEILIPIPICTIAVIIGSCCNKIELFIESCSIV